MGVERAGTVCSETPVVFVWCGEHTGFGMTLTMFGGNDCSLTSDRAGCVSCLASCILS